MTVEDHDLRGRIIAHAMYDELEKIARFSLITRGAQKARKFVTSGGGVKKVRDPATKKWSYRATDDSAGNWLRAGGANALTAIGNNPKTTAAALGGVGVGAVAL